MTLQSIFYSRQFHHPASPRNNPIKRCSLEVGSERISLKFLRHSISLIDDFQAIEVYS